ncbi:hypothetical protein Tco_1525136, partial [Tanacetum coccineum]
MYHKKNVDYAYLLWEDFIYQVENKNVKKSNEMDDYMFTTIKVVSRHEDTQLYGAILPNELTNEDIRNSESFIEYYAITSGAKPPKTKASVKKKQIGSDKTTTSSPTKGKRLKTSAKIAKPAKKKQHAKTSIDKDEGTGSLPGVLDVPTYDSDDEQISWKSSEEDNDDEVNVSEEDDTDNDDNDNDDNDNDDDVDKDINDDDADNQDDDNQDDDDQEHDDQDDEANDDAQDKDDQNQDDDNEQTDLDNNGDDFVHPKFSTHDKEETDEESFDPKVQTPSHVESTNDKDDNKEVQGVNIEGEEIDEEANSEESGGNELYRDLNVNLEGRDVEMTDAQPTNVQTTQVTEDTHVIITLVIHEGQ